MAQAGAWGGRHGAGRSTGGRHGAGRSVEAQRPEPESRGGRGGRGERNARGRRSRSLALQRRRLGSDQTLSTGHLPGRAARRTLAARKPREHASRPPLPTRPATHHTGARHHTPLAAPLPARPAVNRDAGRRPRPRDAPSRASHPHVGTADRGKTAPDRHAPTGPAAKRAAPAARRVFQTRTAGRARSPLSASRRPLPSPPPQPASPRLASHARDARSSPLEGRSPIRATARGPGGEIGARSRRGERTRTPRSRYPHERSRARGRQSPAARRGATGDRVGGGREGGGGGAGKKKRSPPRGATRASRAPRAPDRR